MWILTPALKDKHKAGTLKDAYNELIRIGKEGCDTCGSYPGFMGGDSEFTINYTRDKVCGDDNKVLEKGQKRGIWVCNPRT